MNRLLTASAFAAILILSSLVVLPKEAAALSAVTFTTLDTVTSQNSQFQRVYENSTDSIVFLDASTSGTYYRDEYDISGQSVDSDTLTVVGDAVLTSPTSFTASSTDTTNNIATPMNLASSDFSNVNLCSNCSQTRATEGIMNTNSLLYNQYINKVTVHLSKTGSPTGTIFFKVWDSSGSVRATIGSIDVSTLTGSGADYTATLTSSASYLTQNGDRIGIEYTGGSSGTHQVNVFYKGGDAGYDGANSKLSLWQSSAWAESTNDLRSTIALTYNVNDLGDGSTTTAWRNNADSESGAYVYTDLTSSKYVSGVRVYFTSTSNIPQSIDVYVSDSNSVWGSSEGTWSTSDSVGWQTFNFTGTSGRYVKLQVNTWGTDVRWISAEYQVFTNSEVDGLAYNSPVETDSTHWIVGRIPETSEIIFAKVNTATFTIVSDSEQTSQYKPRDIVQSRTKLYTPASRDSSTSGDLVLTSINRDFTSFTQTTLYNGTGAVPAFGINMNVSNAATSVNVRSGAVTIAGERATSTSALVGKYLDRVDLYLSKSGSPTGTASIVVANSAGSVVFTCNTQNVASLTTSEAKYSYSCATQYLIQSDDRIGLQFTGGDGSNYVKVHYVGSDVFDGSNSVMQQYEGGWANSNGDLKGVLAEVVAKSVVYEGSPDAVYTVFESGSVLKVVKYTNSATLLSDSLTHTVGQPFQVVQLTNKLIIQTSSKMYQLLTSTDAITEVHANAFNTKYPQTFTINSSARTFSSNPIYVASSTYAETWVPSSGTTAQAALFVDSVDSGTENIAVYDPTKYYYLPANDLTAEASTTTWTIKEIGDRDEIAVSPYTERLSVPLAANSTVFDANVIRLVCDASYQLSSVALEKFAVGDDSDCISWTILADSSATVGRQLPYETTPEPVHANPLTAYSVVITDTATPAAYYIKSIYDGKTVDQATFDSGATVQQRYLYGQCYTMQIINSNSDEQVLVGTLCANDITTKEISLTGGITGNTVPINGQFWQRTYTLGDLVGGVRNINYTVTNTQTPFNISLWVTDALNEDEASIAVWHNFTNVADTAVLELTNIYQNQTIYIKGYNSETLQFSDVIAGNPIGEIDNPFEFLGTFAGIPFFAFIGLSIMGALFTKKYEIYSIVLIMIVTGIMYAVGWLPFLDPAKFAIIIAIGGIGIFASRSRSTYG